MLYPNILVAHNILRWLVLAFGLVALVKTAANWRRAGTGVPATVRPWTAIFVGTLDLQFLLGLILYLVESPVTRAAFENMPAAMKDHELRFFTVEHTTYMLIALIAGHIGSVLARRARYRGATIGFGIALLVMLAGIPWWRPLLRWPS
jgi:hypothetical protein